MNMRKKKNDTTIRIYTKTHQRLKRIKKATGVSITRIIEEGVKLYVITPR